MEASKLALALSHSPMLQYGDRLEDPDSLCDAMATADILDLYQRAMEDYLSVPLLEQLISYATNLFLNDEIDDNMVCHCVFRKKEFC